MIRISRIAIVAALTCALGAAAVWLIASKNVAVGRSDFKTFINLVGLSDNYGPFPYRSVELVDPFPFALFATAILCIAGVRRRLDLAIAVVVLLVAANLSTQFLKEISDFRAGIPTWNPNGWPSGHTTAAMSLALSMILVSSARWRPYVAAFGGIFATGVGFALLMQGEHLASDVLGGMLVAATWGFLVLAGLALWANRSHAGIANDPPSPPMRVAVMPALVALIVLLLGLMWLSVAKVNIEPRFLDNREYMLWVAPIGLLGFLLTNGLGFLFRTPTPTRNREMISTPEPARLP